MASIPPEQQTQQQGYGGGYGRPGMTTMGGMMPVPGNAELVVYVLAVILIAIITIASHLVTAWDFVRYFTYLTVAYIISRGIAKASRVLER